MSFLSNFNELAVYFFSRLKPKPVRLLVAII
ncbi:MAG: hypothetical protein ACI9XO_003836 [Paraglaciecola sp.]